MGYRVIKDFTDLEDKNHVYLAGDMFPREGMAVSDERVAELASRANKRGEVLIAAEDVPETAEIQPVEAENPKAEESAAKVEKKRKKAKKKEK